MKKALPIILAIIAVLNIVGFMPYYYYALDGIKHEMTVALTEASQLEKVHITTSEMNNRAIFEKTDDEEFTFNGRMYDFKKVEKVADGFVFYALEDSRETSLTDLLKSVFEQGDNSSKTKGPVSNLLKNLFKDFIGNQIAAYPVYLPVKASPVVANALNANTCNGYCAGVLMPPDYSA